MRRTRGADLHFAMTLRQLYAIGFMASALLMLLLFLVLPEFVLRLSAEDGWVENVSAAAYFAAFVLSGYLLTNSIGPILLNLFVASIGLLGFLDEIGFGTRLFESFDVPIILGRTIDGVHDVFTIIAIRMVRRLTVTEILSLSAIGLMIAGGLIILFEPVRRWILRACRLVLSRSEYSFLFLAIFFVLAALIMDTEIGFLDSDIVSVVEEFLEMHSGFALLFCGLILYAKALNRPWA